MELNELWFGLVSLLFIGFFFLEGFDFGVGIATRLVAKSDLERRILINSIGPFWDANEVWLLTGTGAIFAAFPHWYSTMLSGYYVPFVLVLLTLMGRGVAFEFRGKVEHQLWKKAWDFVIFLGSLLPPLLFGIIFTSLLRGMPIDKNMNMHAGITDYLNLYSVMGGVTITVLCFLHGLLFLTLKTVGDLQKRARDLAKKVIYVAIAVMLSFAFLSYAETDVFSIRPKATIPLLIGVGICYVLGIVCLKGKRDGWAFVLSGMGIVFTISSIFVSLFPRVMISSLNSQYNLTIYNAASGPYSLKLMTIVSLSLLPFVLGYQIWSYYVFRKRVDGKGMIY